MSNADPRFKGRVVVLLQAGINDVEATAASLPQLTGFTAYPTTIFPGRDGRVKAVYAGFRGPATGAQHAKQLEDYDRLARSLLDRQGVSSCPS